MTLPPFAALGPLIAQSGKNSPSAWPPGDYHSIDPTGGLDLMNQIIAFLEEGLGQNPLAMIERYVCAERTFKVLIEVGYERHRPLLRQVASGLDEVARMLRMEAVRRLLLGTIPDEQAKECLSALADQIDRGAWPEWRADIDSAEAALCA